MNSAMLVKRLNDQMNREISTCLRYIVQAAAIRGVEHEPIRATYRAEVLDEIGHAQELADRIVELGGTPQLDPELPSRPVDDVEDMLRRDISAEEEDVLMYRNLVSMADEAALAGMKKQFEDQAAEEDEHGETMRRLLGATREEVSA